MAVTSIFLPRDAMHKRGLCCHSLSVCLSVTFVNFTKTNKHVFNCFSPSDSHTVLVFPHQTSWQYSDGDPLNGGVECRLGRQKIAILSQHLASPRAVNTATARCYQHGAARPWHVASYNTYRW